MHRFLLDLEVNLRDTIRSRIILDMIVILLHEGATGSASINYSMDFCLVTKSTLIKTTGQIKA